MRYTIPPLSFVNYVGIVSRHRLCRSTNSYVPWCPVRVISVSADYSIFIRCSLFCDTLRNSPSSRPSDEREMTERRARQKNADFLTQNEQKLHIYAPKICTCQKIVVFLHPNWVHCATRAYNKVSIQKDSIYAGLP